MKISISHIDHLVLTVKNIPKTIEFYRRVLGMDVETFGDGRTALKFGNQKFNLHEHGKEFEPKALNPTPGAIDLCLTSKTPLKDVVAHLGINNVAMVTEIVKRTGASGLIESVYFRDPDHNLIEVSNYVNS